MNRPYILILMISLLVGSACSGAVPEATPIPPTATEKPSEVLYKIKVASDPPDGGAVAPSEELVPAGTKVLVQAKPAPGYQFELWSGSDSSTSPDMTVTMDKDKTLTASFTKIQTKTPKPTLTPTPSPCKKPAEVTKDDVGNVVEVCGKVTNFGTVPCPECAWGGYSFIKLDKKLLIISYEWEFGDDWLDACLMTADTIELLGNDPVIVFTFGEGMPGSECSYDETGKMNCDIGEYFKPWDWCE